jgi:hypothetical protein
VRERVFPGPPSVVHLQNPVFGLLLLASKRTGCPVEGACKRPSVMYDSSMKSDTYPLAMPSDLLDEVRRVAHETGLSLADAMRQSMKLGLPKLQEQLSTGQIRPFTKEESRLAFEIPNPDFDELEHHCATLPAPPPRADE